MDKKKWIQKLGLVVASAAGLSTTACPVMYGMPPIEGEMYFFGDNEFGNAGIQGTVLNKVNQNPISNMKITLYGSTEAGLRADKALWHLYSNSSGEYRIFFDYHLFTNNSASTKGFLVITDEDGNVNGAFNETEVSFDMEAGETIGIYYKALSLDLEVNPVQ